jgi:exosome complex component RRP46
VLSDDGGLLACAINAVCAALVDAAVPLRTLCAAVAVAQAPGPDGGLLLDPSAAEEAAAAALGTFAYLPLQAGGEGGDGEQGQLLTSVTRGRLTADQLLDMVEAGRRGAERLVAFAQQAARQG